MLTITKRFSNLKAAHRQHKHQGHCKYVHGENWTFDITLAATQLDDLGFVIDFGALKSVRQRLEELFDHVTLLEQEDPNFKDFAALAEKGAMKITWVKQASAEGLALMVFDEVNTILRPLTNSRVYVTKVVCWEDEKNSATFEI